MHTSDDDPFSGKTKINNKEPHQGDNCGLTGPHTTPVQTVTGQN